MYASASRLRRKSGGIICISAEIAIPKTHSHCISFLCITPVRDGLFRARMGSLSVHIGRSHSPHYSSGCRLGFLSTHMLQRLLPRATNEVVESKRPSSGNATTRPARIHCAEKQFQGSNMDRIEKNANQMLSCQELRGSKRNRCTSMNNVILHDILCRNGR